MTEIQSNTPQQKFTIAEVVPHQGLMSLLDAVVSYDEESLQAVVNIRADSLFAGPKGVPAWVGIEYMAQTIAAYSGVQRRLAGREVEVGFLVGTRRYNSNCDCFPIGSTLVVKVSREFQADNGLGSFICHIEGEGISVDASLNVFLPENVDEFLSQ